MICCGLIASKAIVVSNFTSVHFFVAEEHMPMSAIAIYVRRDKPAWSRG